MLKKTITYVDFNGDEVSEDFYFHMSKAELIELQMSYEGGLEESLRRIVAAQDGKAIIAEFKNIILGSYGQRSPDGRRFIKNQTLRDEFESTEAYSTLFIELVTDADKALEFVRGIMPQDLAEEAAKMVPQAGVLAEVPAPVDEPLRIVNQDDYSAMTTAEREELKEQINAGKAKLIP